MQKANLNLLFNLLSDMGIRNVQKEKEILIDTMCNQSVGFDFAGYHLYKQQKDWEKYCTNIKWKRHVGKIKPNLSSFIQEGT